MPALGRERVGTDPEEKSRSQRKREVEALQELGVRLADLTPEQLCHIDLSPDLRAAVEQLRAITTRGARRRQMQYIGALMRALDTAGIQDALGAIDRGHAREVEWERRIERWCDQLIEGDEAALAEIVQRHPGVDRQRLRQLARNAHRAPEGPERTRAARVLFRCLRAAAEPGAGGAAPEGNIESS